MFIAHLNQSRFSSSVLFTPTLPYVASYGVFYTVALDILICRVQTKDKRFDIALDKNENRIQNIADNSPKAKFYSEAT